MHNLRQRRFLLVYFNLPAFNPAHIQHVVYEAEQMVARRRNLRQIILHLLRILNMRRGQGRKPDNCVHRGADVMGHII